MSRLWDTPDFWIRSEADQMLRDCPVLTADALADRFERRRSLRYGDAQFADDIVAELRKRAYARVRFWPPSTRLQGSENKMQPPFDAPREDAQQARVNDEPEFELSDGPAYWWQRM